MNQLAMAILMTLTLVGSVPAENIIHGARPEECPTPDKCGACHANDRFYKEMSESAHKDLTCFDCHVPGVVQKNKYERADRSFNRLGYLIEGDKWHEAMGNDICLLCHPQRKSEKGVTGLLILSHADNRRGFHYFPKSQNPAAQRRQYPGNQKDAPPVPFVPIPLTALSFRASKSGCIGLGHAAAF